MLFCTVPTSLLALAALQAIAAQPIASHKQLDAPKHSLGDHVARSSYQIEKRRKENVVFVDTSGNVIPNPSEEQKQRAHDSDGKPYYPADSAKPNKKTKQSPRPDRPSGSNDSKGAGGSSADEPPCPLEQAKNAGLNGGGSSNPPVNHKQVEEPSPMPDSSSNRAGASNKNKPAGGDGEDGSSSSGSSPGGSSRNSPGGSSGKSQGQAQGGTGSSGSDFVSDMLDIHNKYRAQHSAAPLTWDQTLADYAAQHVPSCRMKHTGGPYGENLYITTGNDINRGLDLWYEEKSLYNYQGGQFDTGTGHFTQMVWKGSRKLGCAVQKSCGYLMCEYSPAGNVLGSFQQNVTPN